MKKKKIVGEKGGKWANAYSLIQSAGRIKRERQRQGDRRTWNTISGLPIKKNGTGVKEEAKGNGVEVDNKRRIEAQ